MAKTLLLLAAGVAVGYQLGWKDAQNNSVPVVERAIDRVRSANEDRYRNDIDGQMTRLEGR
jgi:hypothetical protein